MLIKMKQNLEKLILDTLNSTKRLFTNSKTYFTYNYIQFFLGFFGHYLNKKNKENVVFLKKRDFIFAVENKMNNTLNFEVCLTHYANHTTSVSLAIFFIIATESVSVCLSQRISINDMDLFE